MRVISGMAIVAVFALLTPSSHAQEIVKSCAGVEVRSLRVSAEVATKVLLDGKAKVTEAAPDKAAKAVTLIAYGPVLGSMDSPNVEAELACTTKGFVLTAIITRSANYNGAVLQNVNWRPTVSLAVALLRPEVVVQTIWRMRLTTGSEVDHAQTPPYAGQKYPIRITKTIRPSSG